MSQSDPHSAVLSCAENFDKILEVDKSAYTVRVQAGLKVLSLGRWADKNGMAWEVGAPTNYAELTIGGVISANGHGTGSNVTSSMVSCCRGKSRGNWQAGSQDMCPFCQPHDISTPATSWRRWHHWHSSASMSLCCRMRTALKVQLITVVVLVLMLMMQGDIALEFTWVDASGVVRTSDRHSPEGKGLAGGVGLIGIITEIKLQMTPPSNTKAISKNLIPDINIGQDTLNYVKVGVIGGVCVFGGDPDKGHSTG